MIKGLVSGNRSEPVQESTTNARIAALTRGVMPMTGAVPSSATMVWRLPPRTLPVSSVGQAATPSEPAGTIGVWPDDSYVVGQRVRLQSGQLVASQLGQDPLHDTGLGTAVETTVDRVSGDGRGGSSRLLQPSLVM